jgi:hypothetical protein
MWFTARSRTKLEASKNLAILRHFLFHQLDGIRDESMRGQPGFFDIDERLKRLSHLGDHLEAFLYAVDFEMFRSELIGTPPAWLSITHNFCSGDGTQLDVHQAGQSPPHNHISGRWVVGAS